MYELQTVDSVKEELQLMPIGSKVIPESLGVKVSASSGSLSTLETTHLSDDESASENLDRDEHQEGGKQYEDYEMLGSDDIAQ